jgi:hypothetical protein
MNLFDIVFLGWYHILDNTIYSSRNEHDGIGPKEHSVFISFLCHGLNLWTAIRYLTARFFNAGIPIYASLTLFAIVFLTAYFFYYKTKANKVLDEKAKIVKIISFAILALIYAVVSVYLMFKVGDFVRHQLGH